METVIVTGVSGAGKTTAIDFFEDFGYFCIDNMPLQLLPKFTELCVEAGQARIAVVTDIRSFIFSKHTPDLKKLKELKNKEEIKIVFLNADDATVIRRYQQSRRKHPLSARFGSLEKALAEERTILNNMLEIADEVIDTSDIKPGDLYETLRDIFEQESKPDEMQLNIISFGFKYGTPRSADFVFDARFLPNPFYIEELKLKTGEDVEVQEYVMQNQVAQDYMNYICDLLIAIIPSYIKIDKTHLTVAFGCTGGQHRSVTFACLLEKRLKEEGYRVNIEHRDILKDRANRS